MTNAVQIFDLSNKMKEIDSVELISCIGNAEWNKVNTFTTRINF